MKLRIHIPVQWCAVAVVLTCIGSRCALAEQTSAPTAEAAAGDASAEEPDDALPLVLPESVALRWMELMRQPMFAIAGILIAWNVFGPIFRGAFRTALAILYPGSY